MIHWPWIHVKQSARARAEDHGKATHACMPLLSRQTCVVHRATRGPSVLLCFYAAKKTACRFGTRRRDAGFVTETRAGLAGRRKKILLDITHRGAMFSHRVSQGEELEWVIATSSRDLSHSMTHLDEEKNFSTSRLVQRIGLL